MSLFTLPNPTVPAPNAALQSAPVLQNFQAIATFLNALDGGNLLAGSVTEAALAVAVDPRQRAADAGTNYVASGMTITGTSGTVTVAPGVYYANGYRVVYSGGSASLTASSDVYIDADQNGVIHFTGSLVVANNANSPTLTANSIRLGIVSTNGSNNVTSINQGSTTATLPTYLVSGQTVTMTVCDSIGNLIYPCAPSQTGIMIGYRGIGVGAPAVTINADQIIPQLYFTVIIPPGRQLTLKMVSPASSINVTGNAVYKLWDGVPGSGTVLQTNVQTINGGGYGEVIAEVELSPNTTGSPISKTYSVSQNGGGNTLTTSSSATAPVYLTAKLS